jgi:hypothetical protein
MNVVFVPWLGHAGLALSIGLGALVNATWLLSACGGAGCTAGARLVAVSWRVGAGHRCAGAGLAGLGGHSARLDRAAGRRWLRAGWLAACWGRRRCCTSGCSRCASSCASLPAAAFEQPGCSCAGAWLAGMPGSPPAWQTPRAVHSPDVAMYLATNP